MKRLWILILALVLTQTTAFARDYTPNECPVVGNTQSRIYHVQGGYFYQRILKHNKGSDNRECFATEAAAKKAGYRPSKR